MIDDLTRVLAALTTQVPHPSAAPPIEAMVEAVATALETADVGYSMSLVRLIDGVSTYELRYDDGETLEFSSSDEVYEHVAQKKRLVQATAAIAAVLSQQVLAKGDKYSQEALLVAAKKLRRLRIETVGGRKERAARTIGSIIDREGDLKGDEEFVAWVIKNAIRYYAEAVAVKEGGRDG
ncbi:MAG: hypothetical protein E5W94_11460 [Mesorhizobium sp.]|nr:MAG: hypothetical protein E5W94_11460 [Mesorhizobium sp.]